jgi:hypothetical protein
MGDRPIGIRDVRALRPGATIWDGSISGVPGFGARRQSGTIVSFLLAYRTEDGRQRRLTIGKSGQWTPEGARARGGSFGSKSIGGDPAGLQLGQRRAQTVAEAAGAYLGDCRAGKVLVRRSWRTKRDSTIEMDSCRVNASVKRAPLGKLKLHAVTCKEVEEFRDWISAGKARDGRSKRSQVMGGSGAAARTVALLSAIFKRVRPDDPNPCRGVVLPAGRQRARRLSDSEYPRLQINLECTSGTEWPIAADVARFLAVTGWRAGKATKAALGRTRFGVAGGYHPPEDGPSKRVLGRAAVAIIEAQPGGLVGYFRY